MLRINLTEIKDIFLERQSIKQYKTIKKITQ